MSETERIIDVRYKKHATLILRKRYRIDTGESEKYWEFTGPDLVIERELGENEPTELIEILEDLFIEGWELVCPLLNEDGYILRATDYIDDTITIYDYDEELESNEEEMKE